MRTHMLAVFVTATAFFSHTILLPEPTRAQDAPARAAVQDFSVKPIGKVVTATGSVTIEHVNAVVIQATLGNQARTKIGDPVYLGDVVSTGADGRIGITFTDGTAFDLSSNARMVMTEFIYDPNSKSNSTFLTLTKGTFTFVAGKVAKSGDMKIDTPVATMGIRGTTPRVEISDDGTVRFSTLIEEGKDKVSDAASIRRSRSGSASPGASTIEERGKPNLDICRGC